jgi:hypothetical protein
VHGYPNSKALWISVHESVILMRVNRQIVAFGKNQSPDWLGVNQDPASSEHVHDALQRGMMWQRMERFQIEYFPVSALERWVRVTARSVIIGDPLKRIMSR